MKIVVISSFTPSLFWFRIDMMKDFIKHGHTVTALGPDTDPIWKERFETVGIEYNTFFVERNGINPLNDIRTYRELNLLLREEKPDKVFAYQAKTVIYGSLAAKANDITEFYPLIAGLGSIFRGGGIKNKIIKTVMMGQYKVACSLSKKVFFQNNDDKKQFVDNRLVQVEKVHIINGSGVNLDKFTHESLPKKPAFLFIGRLIKDKGIIEYLEACKELKKEFPNVRCLLVGPYDSNPTALSPRELKPYLDQDVVEYFGEQSDVRPYLKLCTTFVLPSYHEGTPKTILEAMAVGRSIITTDAPGCRETVTDGYNGYLVPIKDTKALVGRMKELIENQELNEVMAIRNVKLAKEKYDVKIVNQAIMATMGLHE